MRLGLIGSPVSHSLSPKIFEKISKRANQEIIYDLFNESEESVLNKVATLKNSHRGLNITLPFKQNVLKIADWHSDEVMMSGACNTICFDKEIKAYNTDILAIKSLIEVNPNKKYLIFGAGGAARACLVALIQKGAKNITIVNRSEKKAMNLIDDFESKFSDLTIDFKFWEEPRDDSEYDGFFQMSSIELLTNDQIIFFNGNLKSTSFFFEANYKPFITQFLNQAPVQSQKINGVQMLVRQALYSFSIWNQEHH